MPCYRRCWIAVVVATFLAVTGVAAQETESIPVEPVVTSGPDLSSPGKDFTPIRSDHVVVIMEENRSENQAQQYMTYLNSLADQYGQGLQVYSDSHGSWLAYGELTSGLAPFGGEGDHGLCNGDGCTQVITIDNIVRRLISAHKTWRGYFQSLPSIGYLGYESGNYVRRHNPFAFYSDVVYSLPEQHNLMPADPYMLHDIVNNNLANFTWISPDLEHDAHNGTTDQLALIMADDYLRSFVPQLLMSPPFQPGGNGVLLVTFDEGEPGTDDECGGNPDPNNCGGHIWSVVIGPKVKAHYVSNIHRMQGSQLRLICDLLGVMPCPGDGATSPPLSDFFHGLGTP
jgi:acid phosphatase